MILDFFRAIVYQPLFNGLVLLYEHVSFEDLGLAIIFLTIAVRLVLFPLFHKTAKHQKISQELQPKVKEIRKKYKDDKEAQTKALMDLYKDNQINPITPIFLLILQMPVLFSLYRIFINGFSNGSLDMLYSFVSPPAHINQTLLGIVTLSKVSIPLVIAAAIAQYIQGVLVSSRSSKNGAAPAQAQKMAKIGIFMGPAMALIILMRFPSAVALYWLTSTIFSIIQQIIINRSMNKEKDNKAENERA
jgi:YidC/Oxa1 family membrane protein insertase